MPVAGPAGRQRRDANALARRRSTSIWSTSTRRTTSTRYYSNYHIWETLVRWDQPEAYGVARKRVDCRTPRARTTPQRRRPATRSPTCSGRLQAPWLLLSLSNEALHDREQVREWLAPHGHVGVIEVSSKRYVGAQIGIHNPAGERVGAVSHLTNSELLFLVGPDRVLVERALALVSPLVPT